MKRRVIVCIAMPEEGGNLVEKVVQSLKIEGKVVEILYTDIGLINATYSLTKRITEAKERGDIVERVVNIGTAGGRGEMKVGDIVECQTFAVRDADQTAIGFPMGVININSKFADDKQALIHNKVITNFKKGICGSGNNFESSSPKLPECNVVEMEAAALMKVCIRENVPFIAIKYISDAESKNEGDEWKESLKIAPKKLAVCLEGLL
jgi:adenosylhomocysteine nucleosidase